MKKQRTQQENGLSELQGSDIPKAVRKKNGLRLKAKHHRRLVKGLAGVAACAVLVGGTFAVNALFFNKAAPNTVEEGFVTVSYELPTDGSTPDMHSALENIGYMNTRFRAQTNYYSEMSGTVDTMLTQQVNTWKQYHDGVLVQTDITRSSMVNSARQFCYVGDRVIWRDAAGGPSTYNGLDTEWQTGDPAGNMTIDDFKASRGLPGTEFSVYVINEDTLLGAEEVVSNGDGTYSQTYYLDPATDKAPAYYVNQMMTTGGLTGLPTFEYITVTYTFDSTWQVLASDIDESYTATMGISVGCRATYHTAYEYGTEKAESTVYEDYYSEYASKPATGAEEESPVTAAGCLSSAFAPVLQGPATFRLGLTLDDKAVEGLVYVNAADLSAMELRARIGALYVAYAGGDVYLRIGDNFRGSLDPMQFATLFTAMTGEGDGSALDTDALLEQLGSGTFTVAQDNRSAALSSVLTISGMELPVDFAFDIAEDGKTVSLDSVTTQLTLAGMQVGAELSYSSASVPEVGDPATYSDLTGMVLKLADLVTGDAMDVDLAFTLPTEIGDIALRGNVALDFASLSVRGSLDLAFNGAQKTLDFAYQSDASVVYLAMDGVKVRVAVSDVMEIVTDLLGASLAMPEASVDAASLIDTLLSLDLASMVSTSEEGVTIAAGQLLAALGVSLDLGDVTIGETENGVSVSAMGADIALAPTQAFTVTAGDYADYVDVGPWLEAVASLATAQALEADVAYETEELAVNGTLELDFATLSVKGEVSVTWNNITKQIAFAYTQVSGEHIVYLAVDGIKVKASVAEVMDLLGGLFTVKTPETNVDAYELLTALFSLDLSEVITLTNDGITLDATQLLALLGVDLSIGEVEVTRTENGVSVSAMGADIALAPGEAFTVTAGDYADYVDVGPWLEAVASLATAQALEADVAYETEELAVNGTLELDFATLSVKGEVSVTWNNITKQIAFAYTQVSGEHIVYLAVDGIKVKASVAEVMDLLGGLFTVKTPETNVDAYELLTALFSLDLSEVITLTNDGITLDATQLLALLGVDLSIGDVELTRTDDGVAVSAMGADIALAPTQAFTVTAGDYTDYVDVVPWLEAVASLATAQALEADVAYETEELAVNGTLELDFATLSVKGEVSVTWNNITKQIAFAYTQVSGEHIVYLAVDGIKVKASVAEVMDLLGGLFTVKTPETNVDAYELLTALFSLDLSEVITLTNDGITLDATQLLALLGVDLSIGEVEVTRTENGVAVSAMGADIALAPTQAFTVTAGDYTDYVDAVPWIEAIMQLVQAKAWMLEISYTSPDEDIRLAGTLAFDLASESVACGMNIDVKGVRKGLSFAYDPDGDIFCNFDGIRIRATASELTAFLSELLGDMPQTDESIDVQELLTKLLSLDLSTLVTVTEDGIRADATQLLSLFGIDLALGDVQLSLFSRGVRIEALGLTLSLSPGVPFEVDGGSYHNYVDVTPLFDEIMTVLTKQEIALSGSLDIVYGDLALDVAVENGVLSWKNGIALCADLTVTVGETKLSVSVDANENRVRIVFGTLAVELSYSELEDLKATFADVYARIAEIVNRSAANGSFLPAQAEELGSQLGAGAAVTDLLASLDLQSLLQQLKLGGASDREGSIATITLSGAVLDLCMAQRGVALYVNDFALGGVSLGGMLQVCASEGENVQVQREYLKVRDLCELIDFVGAAVGTLASPDLSIAFTDGVTVNTADESTKFTINGKLVYHSGLSGAGFPIVVDTQGKVITVDPDAYLYFNLLLDEKDEAGTDLNFEFWMLDSNGDRELEFFVSLSKFLPDSNTASNPLRFAVSASDVMTLLSGGLSLVGGEGGVLDKFLVGMGVPEKAVAALFTVLDEYLVDKWLTPDEAGQFAAVGDMLMNTLGIREKLETMLGGVSDTVSGALEDVDLGSMAVDPAAYLKSFGLSYGDNGEVQFTLRLNSDLVFGGEGMQPLTITMSKAESGGESYLTAIALSNIYGNNNAERTSIPFAFDYAALTLVNDGNVATVTQSGEQIANITFANYQNYTFAGVDDLLKSLALSATHKTQDGYALNDSFYISGTATVSVIGILNITAQIPGITVSLDENGNISANIKLEIPAVFGVTNGDTTFEMTIFDGMAYMRRTQTTRLGFGWTDCNIVNYRVMPLSSFFADILNQLKYILNLTDLIASQIKPGSTPPETVIEDYGVVLYNYLKSYSYTAKADGTGGNWVLTMNGNYLTDSVLSDIGITLGSEQYNGTDNVLRTLDVTTKLVSIIDLTANLAFRNPMNTWEEGYSDLTDDIAAQFENVDFASYDWSAQAENYYIVPEQKTIRYTLEGEVLGEQTVWYNGSSMLSQLSYPDLSGYAREGYTLAWSDSIAEDGTISAAYTPKRYDVTFVSPEKLGDDWTLQADGSYTLAMQMDYDAKVEIRWGESSHTFTVGTQNNVFDLGAVVGDSQVVWNGTELDLLANGATILIPLMPDTVIYTSNGVAFTLGEATNVTTAEATFNMTYTLETPAADGYTFLGWYMVGENGLTEVTSLSYTGGGNETTVSALWMSNLQANVTGKSKVKNGGSWYNSKYDHSATVEISGGKIAGALTDTDSSVSVSTMYVFKLARVFMFDNQERTASVSEYRYLSSASATINASGRDEMTVEVQVTYTFSYRTADGTVAQRTVTTPTLTVVAEF